MRKVNVAEGLSRFDDLWRPKIIAEMNEYKGQFVKGQGELVWPNTMRPTSSSS